MSPYLRALVVVIMALVATTSPPRLLTAQQLPRPTFRAGVEYVEVDAYVVDGKNKPVANMTKDQFRIFEDGKEQVIESLDAIEIPTTVSASLQESDVEKAVTVPADTAVTLNLPPADEARVFVIVLDDRMIHEQRTLKTINVISSFIKDYLGPNDLTAVVSTSGRMDASQAFTTDKAQLLKATRRFMGNKPTSIALASLQGRSAAGAGAEVAFETLASMRFARNVVNQLAAIQGRSKSVLLVSEGADLVEGNSPSADMIRDEERQMIATATRANVTIHTIDPRGLYAYDELTAYGGSWAARGPSGDAGLAVMSLASRMFKAEVDRAQMSLKLIASTTNGLTIVNSNKFEAGFDRIVAQHSTYYLLRYRPQNERREGRFRKIEVRVQGKGLRVQARRGYSEPKEVANK